MSYNPETGNGSISDLKHSNQYQTHRFKRQASHASMTTQNKVIRTQVSLYLEMWMLSNHHPVRSKGDVDPIQSSSSEEYRRLVGTRTTACHYEKLCGKRCLSKKFMQMLPVNSMACTQMKPFAIINTTFNKLNR